VTSAAINTQAFIRRADAATWGSEAGSRIEYCMGTAKPIFRNDHAPKIQADSNG
jgi:hypothetical protein